MSPTKKLVLYSKDGAVEVDLETRQRILEAARELFTTRGFKGVSMRDVAEVVKVTPAALYYYFPQGKEDLFLEVIKLIFFQYAQNVRESLDASRTTREKLQVLARQLLERLQNNNGAPMLMRDAVEYLDKSKHEILQEYRLNYMRSIREIFQEGVDRGEISPYISTDTLASMFHGMAFSFGHPLSRNTLLDQVEINRAADTIVSILLDGVALKRS